MKDNLISEQDSQRIPTEPLQPNVQNTSNIEKSKNVTDKTLSRALALGCFPQSNIMIGVKHPLTGEEVLYLKSNKPENVNSPNLFIKNNFTIDFFDVENKKVVKSKTWTCSDLQSRKDVPLTVTHQEILDLLKGKLGWKLYGEVTSNEVGNFDMVDVATTKELQPGGIFYNVVSGVSDLMDELRKSGKKIYMWKPKKGSTPLKDVSETKQKEILNQYKVSGYNLCSLEAAEMGNYVVIDISKNYPNLFEPGTTVCKKISDLKASESSRISEKMKIKAELNDKFACKNLILLYYNDAIKKVPKSKVELEMEKPIIRKCIRSHKFPGLKKEIKYLELGGRFTSENGILINYNLKESVNSIDKLINENLFKMKLKQNPKLLQESKEVRGRILTVVESSNYYSKKDVELFTETLLGEMINLRREGYNEKVILQEAGGILDYLGGLFGFGGSDKKDGGSDQGWLSWLGGKGLSGVMSTAIEQIGGGLLSYMGLNPKGYVGTAILKTLGNLSPSDLPKLTDCKYLSGLFTKSILETIAAKTTEDFGGQSMIGSFIGNTVFEMGEDSEIFQSIKNFLGDKIICPFLTGKGDSLITKTLKGAMGSKGKQLPIDTKQLSAG
jgi:hypothetical protein